jgi:hypothetical protein
MCSTLEARLARLRAAIDEVALAARAARGGHTGPDGHTELDGHTGPDGNTELDGRTDPSELAERLASLWGMIAELDPALAARLHGYGPDAGWDTPLCRHPGRGNGSQFPTISISMVAVTSGCSRTRT